MRCALPDEHADHHETWYTTPMTATVQHMKAFDDASGAPGVVSVGPYVYAIDTLGDVRLTLIRPVYGSRTDSLAAASAARRAYLTARATIVTPTWLEANRAMYQS